MKFHPVAHNPVLVFGLGGQYELVQCVVVEVLDFLAMEADQMMVRTLVGIETGLIMPQADFRGDYDIFQDLQCIVNRVHGERGIGPLDR